MDKIWTSNFEKTQVPQNDRTDTNIIAQPKMNLHSFKGTPDSLK